MKYRWIATIILTALLIGCNSAPEESTTADNDLDAARSFLQAALKGKYNDAAVYMLHDSLNDERLDAVSRLQLTSEEKQGLWDASINIHNRKLINDSTSIIIYSNSFYKDNKDTLKVVKKEGKWLVDFKYLFDHE